ncbi:MFS transporter [Pseudarthrobacter sp. CC12]|uniref:MFS transporter n=1 Tax=Pseudarthrobacter sp. CC12 TaxID=3029193 RepID=UPI003266E2E7
MEHSPDNKRAFYSALTLAGSPISQVLANLSLLVLAASLSPEAYMSWGWRVTFGIAVILVGVGIYVRLKIEETPIFVEQVEMAESNSGVRARGPVYILRNYGLTILRLGFIHAPISLTFYIVAVFGISYLNKTGNFPTSATLSIFLIANAVSFVGILVGGRFADRYGRRQTYAVGAAICLVAAIIFFPLADTQNYALALFATSLACFGVQFGNAAQGALFGEAFPTQIRFMGSAMTLSFTNLVFGSFIPFFSAWLIGLAGGNTLSVVIFWIMICILSIVLAMRSKDGKTLEGTEQTFSGRRLQQIKTPDVASV